MSKKLVIVESPTKAKTIRKFLPKGYQVEACMGHIRDLPSSSKEIPEELKKEAWAKIGVNVAKNFEPLYVVNKGKSKIISELKSALKESDELFLATDEDREGESISWHLLETLKPKIPVRRMVFHEITKGAIEAALKNPRTLDMNLVHAQEARRILDRLVGYTVSPLLWKKIAWGLSAGRVQSVAVRIIVLRELERRRFKKATYWGIEADLHKDADFSARLVEYQGKRVATGKDFDESTGRLIDGRDVVLLTDDISKKAVGDFEKGNWVVKEVEEKPVNRKPAPPLITSTLQQEANRKLGLSSRDTMSIAQRLYEQGLITYMRTDSVNMSEEAIKAARKCVQERFGKEYVSPTERRYQSTSKGAQEAHEAIRPSLGFTSPKETGLEGRELDLYELIWMRTVATQMREAEQLQTSVKIQAEGGIFSASGMRIVFPGFLRAYVEGRDDVEAALEDKENPLPKLVVGDKPALKKITPSAHETKPPARYTEASLIQTMEKEGIGRPSTYAATVSTIVDRGYVKKQGNTLIPTFTGMVVNSLMEKNFPDLVDVKFTANMENQLDNIAEGKDDLVPYLKKFYLGKDGLEDRVKSQDKLIDPETARSLPLENFDKTIEIRVGKFGPYMMWKKPDGTQIQTSIPEGVNPADLTSEQALEILEQAGLGPQSLGDDPKTGLPVFLRTGSYGPYIQVGEVTTENPKPKRVSIPKGIEPSTVEINLALKIAGLPRKLGVHPETGKDIVTNVGRFGPYVAHNGEFRSLKKEDSVLEIELPRALALFAEPKGMGRGRSAAKVIKEIGKHPIDGEVVQVLSGKYGPYVKYGKINVTVPKDTKPEDMDMNQALALISTKSGTAKAAKAKSPRAKKPAKPKKEVQAE